MNKIYNNLTVENLINTDWINQFDKKQKEQIRLGLKANLDVSIYAKPVFDWKQMWQIKLGLEDNLDASIYAKKDFSWEQMKKN